MIMVMTMMTMIIITTIVTIAIFFVLIRKISFNSSDIYVCSI